MTFPEVLLIFVLLLLLLAGWIGFFLGSRRRRPSAWPGLTFWPVRRISMGRFDTRIEPNEEGLFAPKVVDDDGDAAEFEGEFIYEITSDAPHTGELVPVTEEERTQFGVDANARWVRGTGLRGLFEFNAKADGKVGEGETFVTVFAGIDFQPGEAADATGGFAHVRKIQPPPPA